MSARAEDETNTCIAMHCTVIGNEWGAGNAKNAERKFTSVFDTAEFRRINSQTRKRMRAVLQAALNIDFSEALASRYIAFAL